MARKRAKWLKMDGRGVENFVPRWLEKAVFENTVGQRMERVAKSCPMETVGQKMRHVLEWMAAVRASRGLTWGDWAKMVRGLWSMVRGRVDRGEFWRRARVCVRCPVYDRELRRCAGPWVGGKPTGCGCYLPYKLRSERPYPAGCWGRQYVGGDFGWGWTVGRTVGRAQKSPGGEAEA